MSGISVVQSSVLTRLALTYFLAASLQACALTSPRTQTNTSIPDNIPAPVTLSPVHNPELTDDAEPALTSPSDEQNACPVEESVEPKAVSVSDNEQICEEDPPPKPRKKRKKPSPLERLRQLYFLPLLHPLGRGG